MKPNKEQIEAYIRDGKFDAASCAIADWFGPTVAASEIAGFIALVLRYHVPGLDAQMRAEEEGGAQ